MNYRELLQWGCEKLKEAHILDAVTDAWYLLEYLSGMKKQTYYLRMEESVPDTLAKKYRELIAERSAHIPLQYITGEQEFMGFPFYVNPEVLIPRQDTEILVEKALQIMDDGDAVLDLCTGSGCILISLLKNKVGCRGVGADISAGAIKTAEKNAKRNQVEARWMLSDLFSKIEETFDLIVSNPPYIPTAEIKNLMPEVAEHEPVSALDGDEDGLYFYKKICGQAGSYLHGKKYLLFEIGHNQGAQVASLMKKNGYRDVEVIRDYGGNDRVVLGHL